MIKKFKIFIFWIGNKEIENQIRKKFSELSKEINNIEVVFGPTKKEHDLLLKECKYYRKSYNNKTYAFCSDAWRVFKLSKENGMYLDASLIINKEKFKNLINELKKYDAFFIRESYSFYLNGVLFSNCDWKLFKKIYKYYCKKNSFSKILSGPVILSYYLKKEFKRNKQKILIKNAKEIEPYGNGVFQYNGFSSWHDKKDNGINHFIICAKSVDKKPSYKDLIEDKLFTHVMITRFGIIQIWYLLLKIFYFSLKVLRRIFK